MSKVSFFSRPVLLKLAVFAVFCMLGCSASTPVAAQSLSSNYTIITPGTPFFSEGDAFYQVTVREGNLTAYTLGDAATRIRVYDSSAKLIVEDQGSDARISVPVSAGTYYIRVSIMMGDNPYSLRVEQ